jgi:hypothetical protein
VEKDNEALSGNYWWTEKCAPHNITLNVDNDAAVNSESMQKLVINSNGDELFIDFPKGKATRAFPGLLMDEVNWSTNHAVITYTNIYTAYTKAKAIAKELKSTDCSGLNIYLVGLKIKQSTDNKQKILDKRDNESYSGGAWNIWTGLTGGAAALTSGWVAASPLIAKIPKIGAKMAASHTAATAGAKASYGIAAGGAASAAFWIAIVVGAATAVTAALYPFEIEEDIEQVMVLSDPFHIY